MHRITVRNVITAAATLVAVWVATGAPIPIGG
ncbi:MAG: hypothetical protein JWN67_4433 [Actinomycetia bacterium]|nr:hypothetical protein [Actinomycetes bacterium]